VGALGHFLEEEGVATTQISLIREHTEAIKPPRALWVSFMLGRPFGTPGDARFQRGVVDAALRLLEADAGPVLADYPHDSAHAAGDDASGFACPVNFAPAVADDTLANALQREIAELAPWYAQALRRNGRTLARVSGLSPEAAGRFLATMIADSAGASFRADLDRASALRLVCEDLKAYYLEAVSVQPGARAAAEARKWLWSETMLGRAFFALRDACLASPDAELQRYGGKGLIPLSIAPRPEQWVYEAKWR
jgi:hypothetical protein